MLWPAESVYGGTWSSGPVPVEVQWVELMLAYHWSWDQLVATPPYVRRVCWDLLDARRRARQEAERQRNGG